jgi:glycosyltransferase involved in cell wall biosynthesis
MLDQLAMPVPGGIGRYTEELTAGLLRTVPEDWTVEGTVSRITSAERDRVAASIPSLGPLRTGALDRRILSRAWARGLPVGRPEGRLHAPSLFAPLVRPRHAADRLVVTIHDVVPWTHPETLTPHGVRWHRTMAERARRWADAIVVDTAAVAAQLADHIDFGDRVHVVGAAVSPDFSAPRGAESDRRATALRLPEQYVLSVGTLEPRKGVEHLIAAMGQVDSRVPLLVAGPDGWGDVSVEAITRDAGLPAERVRVLGRLDDADLAVAFQRATVFAFPSLAEGFGLPVLEAFQSGTAVVHSDDPAVVEVSGGAGIAVAREGAGRYSDRLAVAITALLRDPAARASAVARGLARAEDYDWDDSARTVWELHRSL